MVAAQLTDVEREKVEIGMPVEMVTRRLREDGSGHDRVRVQISARPRDASISLNWVAQLNSR